MPSQASQHFTELCKQVNQLIAIHGKLQSGQGRRHHQDALHRAGVVLVVAAWEAYVESLAVEGIETIANHFASSGAQSWALGVVRLHSGETKRLASRLHTPNAENFGELLETAIGYNPTKSWSWSATSRQWNDAQCRERVNKWLKVRHSIAHGAALPTNFDEIKDRRNQPRLNLRLLKLCKSDLEGFVKRTDNLVGAHLVAAYAIQNPWPV